MSDAFLSGRNAALFTDLYELTMAQAYLAAGMVDPATFSLYYRTLPERRGYVLSCGIEDVADFVTELRFSDSDLAYLEQTGLFSGHFLDYLAALRFTGDVYGLPDGMPVFPLEPLVEVTAPAPQAQILETWVLNQMHAQSVLATKASRVVAAARGRPVLDFGLRRIHGADGGLKAARAFYIAGVQATSNVLAGKVYGIPIAGTMAHSFVQAHEDELAAFRAFVAEFPDTVLLVDTYDTLRGVDNVVRLARELGDGFRVRGVRLDSGDLGPLAREARRRLDAAGLGDVQIFVSGGLDEYEVDALMAAGFPIDGFGVGTAMGVSTDAPVLDMAYKLVAYAGEGRMKLSTGKPSLPGAKQIFRHVEGGVATGDTLGRRDEALNGTPLLEPIVVGGRRVRAPEPIEAARQRAAAALGTLPADLRGIEPRGAPYPVRLSPALERHRDEVRQRILARATADEESVR
ncbi:MAG TPA: nicotinate phosphoribosyltransferase [Pseudomonadales bacterium]